MANEKLVIELELENGDISKATKKLKSEASKAGEEAGRSLGKNFSDSTTSAFSGIAKKATAILAGIAAAKALAGSFRAVVNAAVAQEDAINELNNSLKTSGDFSEQASSNFQQFASDLQQITRFGDEAILSQIAIAKSFGATNEQAQQIIEASVDLSAALGISLESAVRNVAKTLGGLSGELGESIPQLKELGVEALQAGDGIDFIAQRFAGAAQRDVAGYSGSVDQASNAFGDLLEEVGAFITQNQSVLDAVALSTEAFVSFGNGLKVIREEILGITQDKPDTEIEKINAALSKTANELNGLIDREAELRDGVFGFVLDRDIQQADKLAERIQRIRNERQVLLKQRAEAIESRNREANASVAADEKEIASSESKLNALQLFAQAQIENESLIIQQQEQKFLALQELRNRDLISQQEFLLQRELIEQEAAERANALAIQNRDLQLQNSELTKEALIQNLQDIGSATQDAFSDIGQSSQELGKELANLGTRGFGTLGRNIGAALAKGESVNDAFVESVRATATEAAEAFGDYYIKLGVVRVAAGDPGGGAVLAGGIALKALAGALGSGGGGGASSGGGGAGSFNSQGFQEPFQENVADPQDIERAEERTNLTLNVEGSIIRESELGGFVADILENSSNSNATVIPSLRTARA